MAAALSLDDEVMHSRSVESRNEESEDLMEAVKESRWALSRGNESVEERGREEQHFHLKYPELLVSADESHESTPSSAETNWSSDYRTREKMQNLKKKSDFVSKS